MVEIEEKTAVANLHPPIYSQLYQLPNQKIKVPRIPLQTLALNVRQTNAKLIRGIPGESLFRCGLLPAVYRYCAL